MTISPERERQLCSWSRYPSDALRAIQILIARVRELEKREAEMETAIENLKNLVSIMETEQERLKRRPQCRES